MIRTSLLALLVISIVCTWSGKDFVSLGRRIWRCRSKINPEDINNTRSSSNKTLGKTTTQPVLQVNEIQCSCGKKCKGHRGLKAHQRSCRVIRGLNADLLEDLDTEIDTWNSTDTSDTSPEILRSVENHVKADTVEIKFVANILRKKLQKTDLTCLDSVYHFF